MWEDGEKQPRCRTREGWTLAGGKRRLIDPPPLKYPQGEHEFKPWESLTSGNFQERRGTKEYPSEASVGDWEEKNVSKKKEEGKIQPNK